ncbi:MAG: inverse autotransporter beta domain-containing protein, partial [Planctomycetaceae bacterium]|nr:inverse autotransporter beta domain-containing protein [Planctomycetaceae bacterium]
MKLTVTRSLLALTVLALLSGPTRAQDESGGSSRVSDSSESLPPTADTVFVAPGPQSGPYFQTTPVETWFAPRTYFDARGGVLYGYEESFTSVGAFLPHFFEENAMVFADARGLASYDGRGGANLGLGWRYYMPGYDRFVGLSAWYDFDAGHIRSYNQMGLSFESVGRYMDLRMNGYIPVGNDQNVLATTLAGPGRFNGNSLFLSRFNEIETAFTGFDTEIGGPMPLLGRYGLSGYAGFYFFTGSSGSDFTGVSGRLNLQVNEDWSIGVQSTDDHVFGTNAQIQVVMNLPDGKAGRWLRPLSVRDRMMQSVFRNYRVTVEHEIQVTDELALNPKDNQPYFVVHVDPNGEDGAATGDGSFSNPYNQLAQFDTLPFAEKSQVDIIYVDPRTDGTSINLDDGVTLLSCQRLLSSSLSHSFGIAQFPGVLFDVPNAMLGQPLPVLENNTGGNVVTFADGAFMVQVSGFEINGSATGSGIVGTNNRSVAIDRNVIQNGVNGISLFNLSGLAANSEASFIDRNIIRFNQQDGVNISNSGAGPLDLFITRNHPTDIDLDQLDQVDADGDDVADLKSPDSLDGDGDFSNDGILGNGDDGIDLNADAGSVINVLFQENRIGGQVVNPADGTLTNAGNGDNGIEMDATAASRITAAILDHTPVPVTAPFDDGQGNLTDVTLFTADYRIGFNGNNGIAVTTANSEIDLLNTGGIRNNLINGNGRDTTVGGVGSGTGDDGDGIDIVSTANSTVTLGVFGNSIGAPSATDTSGNDITDPTLGNAGIGLRFSADSGSSLLAIGAADIPATPTTPAVINGNDFSFNAVSGIDIAASGSALVSFNIENNRIRNVVTDPTPPPLAALTFTLDGSSATNPFIITNLSDPGIDIVSVLWNLAPTSVSFDTNNVALNN